MAIFLAYTVSSKIRGSAWIRFILAGVEPCTATAFQDEALLLELRNARVSGYRQVEGGLPC